MENDHSGMSEGQGVGIVIAIIGCSVLLIGMIGLFMLF